jgi:uncharacterized protein (TIGR02444 family)
MPSPNGNRPRREAHALWRFSLAVYRRPGVEAACLALQDRWATDTNLLLLCCWLAVDGRALDKRTLRCAMSAVAHGQAEVIAPLRRARRALKSASLPGRWAADLRKRIAAVELDMEYLEQCALVELADGLPPLTRRKSPHDTARASIDRYLALLSVPAAAAERQHAAAIIAAALASSFVKAAERTAGAAKA